MMFWYLAQSIREYSDEHSYQRPISEHDEEMPQSHTTDIGSAVAQW